MLQLITTKIDKQMKTVSVYRKGVLRKNFQSFKFEELEPGISIEAIHHKGSIFFGKIALKTGEKINIFTVRDAGEGIFYETVDLAN